MNKTLTSWMVATALVAAAGIATAHPAAYVNGTGDNFLFCTEDDLGFSIGGVCFAAGHILPSGAGTATAAINDQLVNPASGFLCQDFNNDGDCGEGDPGEIAILFCGSASLVDGGNWDSGVDTSIWLDGPVFGNPALSPCGQVSIANAGDVTHS